MCFVAILLSVVTLERYLTSFSNNVHNVALDFISNISKFKTFRKV